jgi:hypothetical protein
MKLEAFRRDIYTTTMSRNQFKLLLKMIRFNDNTMPHERRTRLLLLKKHAVCLHYCREGFEPGPIITLYKQLATYCRAVLLGFI